MGCGRMTKKVNILQRPIYVDYIRRGPYHRANIYGYLDMWVRETPTITKLRSSFPFNTPEEKIADMMHDGYTFTEALKHTKKAFKKLDYTISKKEEKYLRSKFKI